MVLLHKVYVIIFSEHAATRRGAESTTVGQFPSVFIDAVIESAQRSCNSTVCPSEVQYDSLYGVLVELDLPPSLAAIQNINSVLITCYDISWCTNNLSNALPPNRMP